MKRLFLGLLVILSLVLFCSCTAETCPDLVGKKYSNIKDLDRYSDYILKVEYKESDKDDADTIVDQIPAANEPLPLNREITVFVSLGAEKKEIPDVKGLSFEDAEKKLSDAGFKAALVKVASAEVAEGLCVETSPKASETAILGSTISVHISMGNQHELIKFISVVGLRLADAKQKIKEAGFEVGSITYVEGEESGKVIEQYPGYHSSVKIAKGSKVELIVGK